MIIISFSYKHVVSVGTWFEFLAAAAVCGLLAFSAGLFIMFGKDIRKYMML